MLMTELTLSDEPHQYVIVNNNIILFINLFNGQFL